MVATDSIPADLKVSCSTYAYSYWELPAALVSIARAGFRGVELLVQPLLRPGSGGRSERHHHLRPEWPDSQLEEVRDHLRRLELAPVCISNSTDFLSPRSGSVEGDVDEVRRAVDLAVRFGAPLVRPFATHALPPGIERRDAIRTVGRALHECGRYAEAQGVRLAVENHGPFPSEAPNMVAILRAADSPAVGLCLHIPRDTAEQLIDDVPDLIWHLHLTDNRPPLWREARQLRLRGVPPAEIAARLGVPVAQLPAESVALGEGGADLPAIVRRIKATGYAGWWNHEGPPEPNPEPTEVRSLAYLERVLRDRRDRVV
jgi:sugar phosphate isomerase/epimerase